MIENDWILRVVKQLTEAIARLLKLGSKEEAETLLQQKSEEHLGMPLSLLARMSIPDIPRVLARPDLLVVYGEMLVLQADVEANPQLRVRAKAIFQLAIEKGSREPDRLRAKIAEL